MKTCTTNLFSGRYFIQNEMEKLSLFFACSDHAVYAGWNMMFFLWGVFRVKKVQATTGKPSLVPQDTPKLIMPFPENIHCLGPVDNVTSGNVPMDVEVTTPKKSSCPLVNGNVDSIAAQVCKGDSAHTNLEHLEPRSMSSVPVSHMDVAPERRQFGIFQVLFNFIIFA